MPVQRIAAFDTWRGGYGGANVKIVRANSDLLAAVFTDEGMTQPAPNPQTLLSRELDGVPYGRWTVPLYTAQAYQLQINNVDQTGVERPGILTLNGEDVSAAVVTVADGSRPFPLGVMLGRRVDVRDEGEFIVVGGTDASPATNTNTLRSAINKVAARGGGFVDMPAGTYAVTGAVAIPEGVTLRGAGRDATILQSTQTGRIFTVASRAGFSRLCLDGQVQTAGSVGVYEIGTEASVYDDVLVKRFEAGRVTRGLQNAYASGLHVSDCVRGVDVAGDKDAGETMRGRLARHLGFNDATISLCSEAGMILRQVDAECAAINLDGIIFDTNTGTALRIIGARNIELAGCDFVGNTVNIDVSDNDNEDVPRADRLTRSLRVSNALMIGGELNLKGNLESVAFERVDFRGVKITLTTPLHGVIALDCREDDATTLNGTPTAWLRRNSSDYGATAGFTTGNAATKAWSMPLASGQRVYLTGRAVGRSRNTDDDAFYHVAVSAERPLAALAYDSQTGNFTPGNLLTGATSGASARIVTDTDGGATGTLRLMDVKGTFIDDEIVSDNATGSATANGGVTESPVVLVGAVTALRAAQETDASWEATFVPNGPEIEFRVTGATGKTVEWTQAVEVVST